MAASGISIGQAAGGAGGRPRRWPARALHFGPVLACYLVFLVVPYLVLLRMSFNRYSSTRMFIEDFTLVNYVTIVTDPYYTSLLLRTLVLGVVVTAITFLLGYPLALKIVRSSPRAKAMLLAIALSPLLINLVVRTYAWMVVLGDKGVVNSWLIGSGFLDSPLPISGNVFAVTVGLSHITLPLMVLSLVGVMESIDTRLVEAAESLGATSGRVLWRVLLPLSMPGIAAGSLLVFCFTISAFVTPALLGGNRVSTVATVIYEKFTYSLNWPVGAALVLVLLVFNFVVIVFHGRLFRDR
ncbi:MAG: ABC transporter permease [Chthoniobacteraceae bacterium]